MRRPSWLVVACAFLLGLALSPAVVHPQSVPDTATVRARVLLDSAYRVAMQADSARARAVDAARVAQALSARGDSLAARAWDLLARARAVLDAKVAPPPAPMPSPIPSPTAPQPAVTPFVVWAFDGLTTAQWRSLPLAKYASGAQWVDTLVRAPGTRASLRFDYGAKSASDPTKCDDASVGFTPVGDLTPLKFPAGTREVWLELWLRFDTGYDTRPPWTCPRAPDQKLVRLYTTDDAQYHALNIGAEGNAFISFKTAGFAEGIYASNVRGPDVWGKGWVRIRMHDRLSCGPTKTGASTVDVAWIGTDGTVIREVRLLANGIGYSQVGPDGRGVVYDGSAVATGSVCAYAVLRVGLNRNLWPAGPMRLWVGGRGGVWLTNPGWT